MTLTPPSAYDIFNNNQAKVECTITGQDEITWQIDGQTVTNNISVRPNSGNKTSTLTRTRTEWLRFNKVRCSANSVTQDLTIHKSDTIEPKVTVYILPEEDISKGGSADVTIVCLVSSSVQQDYFIGWLEYNGLNASIYNDGINFLPQSTKIGFSVTSIYTTTKEKWNKNNMFSCNVWAAGSKRLTSRTVSKGLSNSTEFLNLRLATSCTDDGIEEDEYSSLWSTTSSFIFLFISSLLYSMIFSLVKMKKP
ncbi:Ig heavy chain C region, membrane-bound form [Anarrhichthys ocellatus]|uniref:Ig heavy chain C region, membrane-bound form n=1 Tax=Anarrhichthys ocellatus TaxID=433405 RepID=UPI003F5AB008